MLFTVTLPAARIAETDYVALSRQVVKLVHKRVAVLERRSAVNLDDGWIASPSVKFRRRDDPALQTVVIRAPEEPLASGFTTFLCSEEGQRLVKDMGLVPATVPVTFTVRTPTVPAHGGKSEKE